MAEPPHPIFCTFPARQELLLPESQRLGTEISASFHGDFLTATDINHVLGKLFTAITEDRIPPRKAVPVSGPPPLTDLDPPPGSLPALLDPDSPEEK